MEYLKIRRGSQKRADGSRYAVPLHVKKTRKYGEVIHEKAVPKKKPLLITGPHDSGKSHWIGRLHEHAGEIWGAKYKAEPLFLSALRPLGAWTESPGVEAWYNATGDGDKKPWAKVPAWRRADLLVDYVAECRPVVFVDDAHKLSGRKLDVARRCILPAPLWVVTASQENRIPPSLRTVLLRREHQLYTLSSDAAYDFTGGIMWTLAAGLTVAGWWELGMMVGGLQMLGTGRRAARQE